MASYPKHEISGISIEGVKRVADMLENFWCFSRCVRPDGSAYGTAGKCRKGAERQREYPHAVAITQGRFNIPHKGHAKLIKHMLEKAPTAYVIMGAADKNVDKDLRSQMLRAVLRREGVDLSRVKIVKGKKVAGVAKDLAEEHGKSKVLLMLGEDQGKFLDSMGKSLGISTGTVPRTTEGASSSAIRRMIDSGDKEALRKEFDNDPYLIRLAKVARRVEKNEFSERR